MVKVIQSFAVIITIACIAINCQSALIDWPTVVYNSSNPSGFLKKFQISTDKPVNNKTFTIQAIFYLKKDIQWQGLSDLNIFQLFVKNGSMLDIKDLRQYASDAGPYKAGDNITLGFNFTFNSSQNATSGGMLLSLGDDDRRNNQFIDILFKMPNNGQIQTQKEGLTWSIDKNYKHFEEEFKRSYQRDNLRKQTQQIQTTLWS